MRFQKFSEFVERDLGDFEAETKQKTMGNNVLWHRNLFNLMLLKPYVCYANATRNARTNIQSSLFICSSAIVDV